MTAVVARQLEPAPPQASWRVRLALPQVACWLGLAPHGTLMYVVPRTLCYVIPSLTRALPVRPAPLLQHVVEPDQVTNAGGIRHWQKGELVGSGSFGNVYKALDLVTGHTIAVKQVRLAEHSGRDKEVASLEREIALLRTLDHPNIVQYRGTQRTETKLYIFLEYASGGSVASKVSQFGKKKQQGECRSTVWRLTQITDCHLCCCEQVSCQSQSYGVTLQTC